MYKIVRNENEKKNVQPTTTAAIIIIFIIIVDTTKLLHIHVERSEERNVDNDKVKNRLNLV